MLYQVEQFLVLSKKMTASFSYAIANLSDSKVDVLSHCNLTYLAMATRELLIDTERVNHQRTAERKSFSVFFFFSFAWVLLMLKRPEGSLQGKDPERTTSPSLIWFHWENKIWREKETANLGKHWSNLYVLTGPCGERERGTCTDWIHISHSPFFSTGMGLIRMGNANLILIVAVVAALIVAVLIIIVCIILICRKKKKSPDEKCELFICLFIGTLTITTNAREKVPTCIKDVCQMLEFCHGWACPSRAKSNKQALLPKIVFLCVVVLLLLILFKDPNLF